MGKNLTSRVSSANKAVAQQAEPSLETTIRGMEQQFALAMPRGAEASQLVRDAITCLRQTPKLLECDRTSFLGALMTCAQLGLRPGIGALGQAYILPMNVWNPQKRTKEMTAVFILGYQGMLDLANRSNEIDIVVARPIYEGDQFEIDYGTDELHHKPSFGDRGQVKGYYAKFRRKGSDYQTVEFMSVKDAQEHRDKFAMAKKDGQVVGPWKDHFDAMALKTVVRRLFKWMPRDTTIQNAIVSDESVRLDTTASADLTQVTHRVEEPEAVEGKVMENSRGLPSGVGEPNFDPETGELNDGAGGWAPQDAGWAQPETAGQAGN
ncbi:recombinase RecT [Nesterenkonia rhizosphaerae]|uniref:Recombinase RecT n=1 Tax=Nesterenkonia rhizosphaerae TaxID=1348272 RepID=A0ABP9FRT8_9MICC